MSSAPAGRAEPPPGLVRRRRLTMLAVAAVCAAPVLASYLAFYVVRPSGAPRAGTLVQPPRELPAELSLARLDGTPVPAATLRGQWLLLVVAPSSCGPACERRLFLQRQLREMLGRERDRVDKLWLIADAGRPAPALQAAVDAAPAVTLLRADGAALARWLGPVAADGALLVVDPMGREMMRLPDDADPSAARRDLERLLRASAFWDRPGR